MSVRYSTVYIAPMDPVMHNPEAKKAMDARLARIEGQVRAVRRMIEEDRTCENIAQQLSAARRALDRAFYEMVSCMIRHEPEGAGKVADLLARFG
ncbi:MAG TPA: metal-sensitive transcriptional regulator [Burkholderiales bacterium]|jgi:CsoR family transcriptional regulator, copper-sensing transcriptional repressor|nr:metal-sensitive transcriptional regulator [Burkholderiales bacterium]